MVKARQSRPICAVGFSFFFIKKFNLGTWHLAQVTAGRETLWAWLTAAPPDLPRTPLRKNLSNYEVLLGIFLGTT